MIIKYYPRIIGISVNCNLLLVMQHRKIKHEFTDDFFRQVIFDIEITQLFLEYRNHTMLPFDCKMRVFVRCF